jgi:very-short-patch-repair endonuclease
MVDLTPLRNAIALLLSNEKAYDLPKFCERFGLASGSDEEAFASKRAYVLSRIISFDLAQLRLLAERLLESRPAPELEEQLALTLQGAAPTITEITRRKVLDFLALRGDLSGNRDIIELLNRIWPLSSMPSTDYRHENAAGDIHRHMVLNNDWSYQQLLDRLELRSCSDRRFLHFLEEVVHPLSVQEDAQTALIREINDRIRIDGFELFPSDSISGHTVFKARSILRGVVARPKNLIFAADGPKPDIVLADAINNDLQIVANAEYCLVYDDPIGANGLLWKDLVNWWQRIAHDQPEEPERALYSRLQRSLGGSHPERVLFRRYFETWRGRLGDKLPALVPQVYLHYDLKTIKERTMGKVLPRQRMDFLLLLGAGARVVLEVDGKQHYSSGDRSDPTAYAEMVRADRELRLQGYDVYRFGGSEFQSGESTFLDDFFDKLLRRHRCI